jgi:hypothetical protein
MIEKTAYIGAITRGLGAVTKFVSRGLQSKALGIKRSINKNPAFNSSKNATKAQILKVKDSFKYDKLDRELKKSNVGFTARKMALGKKRVKEFVKDPASYVKNSYKSTHDKTNYHLKGSKLKQRSPIGKATQKALTYGVPAASVGYEIKTAPKAQRMGAGVTSGAGEVLSAASTKFLPGMALTAAGRSIGRKFTNYKETPLPTPLN